jgi:hypothetical protein
MKTTGFFRKLIRACGASCRSISSVAAFTVAVAMLACGRPEAPAPTYGISGTVSGALTSGVTMSLSGPGLTTDETTTTDSSGNYSFTGLREGTYTVKPSLKAYLFRPASAPAVVTGANVPGLNFNGRPSLQVYGRDMGPYWQNVSILQGGVRVNDATVRVNGQLMTHPDGWYEDGYYNGHLTSPVSTGGTIVLEVTRGTSTVTAIGTVPEPPFLTAPSDGATFSPSDDITVTWTSSTQPDRFSVNAQWSCGTNCGTGTRLLAPGSARTLTIPASSLPSGQSITLSVFAYSDGVFSGDDYESYAAYPGMNIRGEWNRVTVFR